MDMVSTPETNDLFSQKCKNLELLKKHKEELLCDTVAKGLFLCKRERPCMQPNITYVFYTVNAPNELIGIS